MNSGDNHFVQHKNVRENDMPQRTDQGSQACVARNEEDVTEHMTRSDVSEDTESQRKGTETYRDRLEKNRRQKERNHRDFHAELEIEVVAIDSEVEGFNQTKNQGREQNGAHDVDDIRSRKNGKRSSQCETQINENDEGKVGENTSNVEIGDGTIHVHALLAVVKE